MPFWFVGRQLTPSARGVNHYEGLRETIGSENILDDPFHREEMPIRCKHSRDLALGMLRFSDNL